LGHSHRICLFLLKEIAEAMMMAVAVHDVHLEAQDKDTLVGCHHQYCAKEQPPLCT
jgi:hypothetical protein